MPPRPYLFSNICFSESFLIKPLSLPASCKADLYAIKIFGMIRVRSCLGWFELLRAGLAGWRGFRGVLGPAVMGVLDDALGSGTAESDRLVGVGG